MRRALVCLSIFRMKNFAQSSTWFSIHLRHVHPFECGVCGYEYILQVLKNNVVRVSRNCSWLLWWSSNGFRVRMHPSWCLLPTTTAGILRFVFFSVLLMLTCLVWKMVKHRQFFLRESCSRFINLIFVIWIIFPFEGLFEVTHKNKL